MIVVGVTGGIGSGKSFVTGIFKELGAYTIDADEIAEGILRKGEPAYNEVAERFGRGILNSDGTVNRKALADIVFNDKRQLDALNKITHGYVCEKMRDIIKSVISSGSCDMIVLDVPLLFSPEFTVPYDKSVGVLADTEVRIARVTERDGISRRQVIERMNNQLSDAELKKRVDYVIENNTNNLNNSNNSYATDDAKKSDELKENVKRLYERLINTDAGK